MRCVLLTIHQPYVAAGSEEFFRSNVRVKKDCDALGCFDVGWYCVRAILWAFNFEVPTAVVAHGGEGGHMQM